MLGEGSNGNTGIPMYLVENHFQFDSNALPQLQLFGDVPVGCSINPIKYSGTDHASAASRPIKRARDGEPASSQQNLHISLNTNFCHDEAGNLGSILNPNPVSTGLRLSYEEEERNSSISSANEHLKSSLHASLFDNGLKTEIERQREDFHNHLRIQEKNMLKGMRDLSQKHTASLLKTLENGVTKKLQEKESAIKTMNRRNKELEDRIKQVTVEAQAWQYKAKYNESVANALKSNIQQLMVQGSIGREGCGESEVDDVASSSNRNDVQLNCRACKGKEVSILLLPCRHLCLCKDCESFVHICPVCQVMKTTSVQVYLS